MSKALIFDLGGVLVANDMFDELQKLLERDVSKSELKSKWLASPAVREFELGLSSASAFAEAIVLEFGLSIRPSDFITAFTGWPKGFYAGATELLDTLRHDYSIGCLSNSNEIHWTSQFKSHFDYSYSSHLLARIKPDVDVFQFVTTDIGCQPCDIMFFDDSSANVDAANSFGWDSYLTDGYVELRRVLKDLDLIS